MYAEAFRKSSCSTSFESSSSSFSRFSAAFSCAQTKRQRVRTKTKHGLHHARTHLFELRDAGHLLNAHLFETADPVVLPRDLLPQPRHVVLDPSRDGPLPGELLQDGALVELNDLGLDDAPLLLVERHN